MTSAYALCAIAVFAGMVSLTHPAWAQDGRTISIRIFDGKSAQPLVPSNLIVRIDHHDEIRNETLHIDSDGVGTVTVPDNAMVLSVQGTYDNGMELYFNCDAGMEKNAEAIHWYSIADILSTGVIAPNECYKGKYERNPRVPLKPGEFDFFVRKIGVRDELH